MRDQTFRRCPTRGARNSSTQPELPALAPLNSCPDHFLHAKIRPLVIGFDPAKPDIDIGRPASARRLPRHDFTRLITSALQMRRLTGDPRPKRRGLSVPGVSMFYRRRQRPPRPHFGEFVSATIQRHARGARDRLLYAGLPAQDATSTSDTGCSRKPELQRLPKERKSLAGQVAFVTAAPAASTGATAITTCYAGACVVLADIDEAALGVAPDERPGAVRDFVRSVGLSA